MLRHSLLVVGYEKLTHSERIVIGGSVQQIMTVLVDELSDRERVIQVDAL